jgi:hypothetical protein
LELRQSYRRVGKLALIKHQRYAHAHQFKRANRSLRKLKTYLGRVIRDIGRRIVGDDALEEIFAHELSLARRVLAQGSDCINIPPRFARRKRQMDGVSENLVRLHGRSRLTSY